MLSNWYFASLGVSYLPEWLHTTANLNIAILQIVKVAVEPIAHCLYIGDAIRFIMQKSIFWRISRPFSQIDRAGNMYLNFSPSWISERMNKNIRPAPRARFFSMGWNFRCLLQVLHVFFRRKPFFLREPHFLNIMLNVFLNFFLFIFFSCLVS